MTLNRSVVVDFVIFSVENSALVKKSTQKPGQSRRIGQTNSG